MDWRDRMGVNPKILAGKPVIKGSRLAVEFIVELLAEEWNYSQILKSYPQLTEEDIRTALSCVAEMNEGGRGPEMPA
jgi:uncharacterized protein (DUF433 family)